MFILGVLALVGIPYSVVEKKYSVSRSYYYSLRGPAEQLLKALFRGGEYPKRVIVVTKHFIERCVICLSLHCRAPIESIVVFFTLVIGISVSKGRIGRIRKRSAEKAVAFDASIPLTSIQEIAIDEIYQQGKPVLTGIDLDTHYVFMIEAAEDRSGDTWAKSLQEKQERGLHAELNVSDGGSGLLKGVQQIYPNIKQQPDLFHMMRKLGREVKGLERKGMKQLQAYYKVEEQISRLKEQNKRPSFAQSKQHWEMAETIDGILAQVDSVVILYQWLREHVGLTEYGYEETLKLCGWILDEMADRFPEQKGYQKEVSRIRQHLPELLSFIQRLREKIQEKIVEFPHITPHDFELLYQQKFQQSGTQRCKWMDKRLSQRFGVQLSAARAVLDELIQSTHRASSMVENVNSRLRCFMDLKREIPEEFLILIKVFFNTKKPLRNRNTDWEGSSAVERLTRCKYPEFLDLVSAPLDYIL